jgi:hypothetical protein
MYSTIFSGHKTVIKHPTPQPKGLGVNSDTAKAFALSDEATRLAENMKKGIYSVPVRLQSNQDKGSTDGLESPNFVQSKEHMLTDAQEKLENSFKVENQQEFIKNHFNKDMTVFMDNLENKKDKAERIAACNNYFLIFFLSLNIFIFIIFLFF